MSSSMMAAGAEQTLFAGAAVLCAAIASVYDVRERRIPNALSGGVLAAGLLTHLLVDGWSAFASSMLAGLLAGGLFMIFFLAGGMGAGDVKLMAAIGCLTGLASLQMLVLATVLAGGLAALLLAIYRGRLRQTLGNLIDLLAHHRRTGLVPHPELNLLNQATLRLPFALPIATGCAVWFCVLAQRHRA